MKYLFLDTETTGTDVVKCGLHQLSGLVIIDDIIVETFDFKIQPFEGCLIDDEALKINNLTKEELYDENHLTEKIIYQKFVNLLSNYVNRYNKQDKFFLVGYNVYFDKQILFNFFQRNNDNYLFSYIWGNHIDVMVLATQYLKNKRHFMIDFKQGTVASTLGFRIEDSKLHNSLYDIYVCLGIYCYITKEKFEISNNLIQTINPNIIELFSNSLQLVEQTEQDFLNKDMEKTIIFGKYKGKTIKEVMEENPGYIVWCYENMKQSLITQTLYEYAKEKFMLKNKQSNSIYSGTNDKVIDHQLDSQHDTYDDDLPF